MIERPNPTAGEAIEVAACRGTLEARQRLSTAAREQIVGLRYAVVAYHTSVIGHGAFNHRL